MMILPVSILEQVEAHFARRQHGLLFNGIPKTPLPLLLPGSPGHRLHRSHSTASASSSSSATPSSSPAADDRGDDNPVRLRFAPSPTGSLHLGGLRTALFNHLLARKLGGKWVLRIEDTDRTRYVPGALEELLECLDWAGLNYDEGPGKDGFFGPYIQSERRAIYDKHLQRLIESAHAYRCFCPAERLDALRMEARRTKSPTHYDGLCRHLPQKEIDEKLASGQPFVVRFRTQGLPAEQQDLVYGLIKLPNISQEDFILVKSDGMPTYHFANVVDDYEMRISHVLRGEEWIPSTPKHLALYQAFGWQAPQFAHMPILVNPDGSKLSKRSGDVKVLDYIKKGYEPEAMINFVALMGSSWQDAKDKSGASLSEMMTMEQLIDNFSLKNLNKHRSTMFGGKLTFLNRGHIDTKSHSQQGLQELTKKAQAAVQAAFPHKDFTPGHVQKALLANKDRLEIVNELPTLAPYFFVEPDLSSAEVQAFRKKVKTEQLGDLLRLVHDAMEQSSHNLEQEDEASQLMRSIQDQLGLKGAALMTPLRYALTGQKSGPSMSATIAVLGKQETLRRLRRAVEHEAQK